MDDIPQIKPNTSLGEDKQSVSEAQVETQTTSWKAKISRPKILIAIFGILFLLLVVLVVLPGLLVLSKAKKLSAHHRGIKEAVASKDIKNVKEELELISNDLSSFQKTLKFFVWTKPFPLIGGYFKDVEAGTRAGIYGVDASLLAIDAIEPYADTIGFAGPDSNTAQSGEDTANDRIEFIIQTIEEILPKMDPISQKALLAKNELEKINTSRYPKEFRGKAIRPLLEKGIDLAIEGATLISKSKPLMQSAPYLLGINGTRTYLLLFQNDKELRPTGGFITAYSIADVTNGKFEPVSSSDIYDLDNRYTPSITAPDPIIEYIKGPYTLNPKLRLRDMNWSPDFKVSMDMFSKEAEEAGIGDIDGIIAVDTEVLVKILNVIGPIGVPGYGNFSTEIDDRCNCPNVIYELESFADVEGPIVWSENEPGKIVFAPKNYDNRKKIVGPLMNSILSNSLGQPKEKLPDLFKAAWDSITQKHILVYLFDEEAQKGAEVFGMAGRITDYEWDYLHINDANLAGRKSNLYVTQEVTQDIEIKKDGTVEKTLTITYKNPQDHDGWLNSVLPNWTRVYVPKGAQLIETNGFDKNVEPYEELGKTVYAGGFELRPKGVKNITIKYRLPFKVTDQYKLFIQKQPGTGNPLYTTNLGKLTEELFLWTDKEFKFRI